MELSGPRAFQAEGRASKHPTGRVGVVGGSELGSEQWRGPCGPQ